MTDIKSYKVTIHFRQENRSFSKYISEGENILHSFEKDGVKLPFSCRNGCCTTCAVKILSGSINQSEGIGLSYQMQEKGYGLLCIAKANGPALLETQEEDEVYALQFGEYLGSIKSNTGNPFDI